MTGQLVRTIAISILACISLFAQTTGPHSTNYYSGGYPAATCANFQNNVCVLAQVCQQVWGNCTGADGVYDPSVGGSGGLGNWQIWVSTNGGGYVTYTSNSSAKSQGFIVVIGSTYDSYFFNPNQAGAPCAPTALAQGYVSTAFKYNWNTGTRYYKVLMQCQ